MVREPAQPGSKDLHGGLPALAPVLRVADAEAAARWYAKLGFAIEWRHQFEPGFPLYLGLRLGQNLLHLSEHAGDAQPDTLLYLYVPDIDAVAQTLGVTEIDDMPWGRDIEVRDPDGNRLRIGTPHVM
ncbi:MAG: glyoxalase superfamily protein [Propionibacteriaceae bacterium]|nr:glyoxalase superfamily protein [Propionibacteriaceae bacterium]